MVVCLGLAPGLLAADSGGARGAKKAFQRGVKAQKAGDSARAYQAFADAARLDPKNIQYVTSREMARQIGRASCRERVYGLV